MNEGQRTIAARAGVGEHDRARSATLRACIKKRCGRPKRACWRWCPGHDGMLNSGAEIRCELAHGTSSIPVYALGTMRQSSVAPCSCFRPCLNWPCPSSVPGSHASTRSGPVNDRIRNGEPSWHMRSAMVPGTMHDRCKGWRGRARARICKTAIGPGRMHGTKGESRQRHHSEPPNGPEETGER